MNQSAVDAATNGDVIKLKSGVYRPAKFRDVPYKQYVIRGFVAVERKRIELIGESGAVLDGASGPPVSALVVRAADGGKSRIGLGAIAGCAELHGP